MERAVAVVWAVAGVQIAVAPRASLFALLVLVLVTAITEYKERSTWSKSWYVGCFFAFGLYAAISSSWSQAPLSGLLRASIVCLLMVGAWYVVGALCRLQRPKAVLYSGWFAIGFFAGFLLTAYEVATDQSFLLWLFNTFPAVRPGKNSMHVVVDGHLAAIHNSNLKWSIASLNLLLWPFLLIVASLTGGRLGRLLAIVIVAAAGVVIFLSPHTTSQIAFTVATTAILASWLAPTFSHRAIAALWMVIVLGVVPLTHAAIAVESSGWLNIKPTGHQRIEMWEHLSRKVASAPLLGAGIRTSYVEAENTKSKLAGEYVPLRHPHNAYLQTWYELGLVGALLLLGAGLSVLHGIKSSTLRTRHFAHATFVSASIEIGSTWDIWQTWLVATLALSMVILVLSVRASTLVTQSEPGGLTFRSVWLPTHSDRQLKVFSIAAAILLGLIAMPNLLKRYELHRRVEDLAICQKSNNACEAPVRRLKNILDSVSPSLTTSKWWPLPYRIVRVGDAVAYYRATNCTPEEFSTDVLLLLAWTDNGASGEVPEKAFVNHSFRINGEPYFGSIFGKGYWLDGSCVALGFLPSNRSTKITVGQYERDGATLKWSKDLP